MWHTWVVLVALWAGEPAVVDEDSLGGGGARVRPGAGVRFAPVRATGWESVGLGAITVRRSWRTEPGQTSAIGAGIRGPVIFLGLRPSVSWRRSFPAPPAAPARARTRRKARKVPPFRDSGAFALNSTGLGAAARVSQGTGLTSWSVRAGTVRGMLGRAELRRATTGLGATRISWRRLLDAELGASLDFLGRTSVARLTVHDGGTRLRVEMRATRPVKVAKRRKKSARPAKRKLAAARLSIALGSGGWRTRAALGVDSVSIRAGVSVARSIRGPGGVWEPSVGFDLNSTRLESRAHLGFAPRLRLGPFAFHAGAGLRHRVSASGTSVRPELTAGVRARWHGVDAGVGWDLSGTRAGWGLRPALSGSLRARPGPFEGFLNIRPARAGVRWSAGLAWRP